MKTKLIFAAAALAMCLVACEKKEDARSFDANLVGTWQWKYTGMAWSPEYGDLTPEKTGKNEVLVFSQDAKWTYFENDSAVAYGSATVFQKKYSVDSEMHDYISFVDEKNDSTAEIIYRIENDSLRTITPYAVGVGEKVWAKLK
jgi:hypothetical protein